MRFQLSKQFFALAILLTTAAAQSDSKRSDPPIRGTADLSSVRAANVDESRIVASSALGACFLQPPQYPSRARRHKEEGRTIVSFEVSENGVAGRPIVLHSSQFPQLDEAALEHMKKCIEATGAETAGSLPPGRYILPMLWLLQ